MTNRERNELPLGALIKSQGYCYLITKIDAPPLDHATWMNLPYYEAVSQQKLFYDRFGFNRAYPSIPTINWKKAKRIA